MLPSMEVSMSSEVINFKTDSFRFYVSLSLILYLTVSLVSSYLFSPYLLLALLLLVSTPSASPLSL